MCFAKMYKHYSVTPLTSLEWFSLIFQPYPISVELSDKVDTLKKGDSALFIIKAFVTDPAANFEFGAFQPLGYNVS